MNASALVVANNMTMERDVAHTLQTIQMLQAFAANGVRVSYAWPRMKTVMGALQTAPVDRVPVDCWIRKNPIRQIEFCLRLSHWQRRRGSPRVPLFTRNIGVAYAAQASFPRVGFEVHDDVSPNMRKVLRALGPRVSLFPISAGLADRLADEGVPRERMMVAHDGVDFERFAEAQPLPDSERPLPPGQWRHTHLYIGTLRPERGMDLMAAAAERLPDHAFVLIGGSQAEADAARESGMRRPNVLVMPAVPHARVPSLLKSYGSLLAPYTRAVKTYRSMSPLKVFEYMASGTPSVVSMIGSMHEILDDGLAYTFDPDTPDTFVNALAACAADPQAARAKADAARTLVGERYTWRQRAAEIVAFMNRPLAP